MCIRDRLILIICILSYSTISAQKYTQKYIKNAEQVAQIWLDQINNHNKYQDSYNILSQPLKERYDKETWVSLITELMQEFGDLNNRTIEEIYFQSEVEGLEDGFYVFAKYSVDYEKTQNHSEFLLLKQNYKREWTIYDYNYEFQSKEKKK